MYSEFIDDYKKFVRIWGQNRMHTCSKNPGFAYVNLC